MFFFLTEDCLLAENRAVWYTQCNSKFGSLAGLKAPKNRITLGIIKVINGWYLG